MDVDGDIFLWWQWLQEQIAGDSGWEDWCGGNGGRTAWLLYPRGHPATGTSVDQMRTITCLSPQKPRRSVILMTLISGLIFRLISATTAKNKKQTPRGAGPLALPACLRWPGNRARFARPPTPSVSRRPLLCLLSRGDGSTAIVLFSFDPAESDQRELIQKAHRPGARDGSSSMDCLRPLWVDESPCQNRRICAPQRARWEPAGLFGHRDRPSLRPIGVRWPYERLRTLAI